MRRRRIGYVGLQAKPLGWVCYVLLSLHAQFERGSLLGRLSLPLSRVLLRWRPFGFAVVDLESGELDELVRKSVLTRRLLSDLVHDQPLHEVLQLADNPAIASHVARALIARDAEKAERSLLLYRTIVLSPGETGPARLAAALRTTQRVAGSIGSAHAEAVFKRCLAMASVSVDPYKPPSLATEALVAAAALLQHHPELDPIVVSAAGQGVNDTLRVTVTAALQRRSSSRAALFGEFLAAWSPRRAEATRFALDADSRYSAADPLKVDRQSVPQWLIRLRGWADLVPRSFLSWAIGPAATLILTRVVEWTDVRTPDPVGYGIAVGLGALLVAVNVLSTELAANRLPGLVARFSSSPPQLRMSYSLFLSFVAVLLLRDLGPARWAWLGEVAVGLLVLLFVGTIVWMTVLLRTLNPSDAVVAFVKLRVPRYRRAGKVFGELQRGVEAARSTLPSHAYVRLTSSPSQTARRLPLLADTRGFVVPRLRRVALLARHEEWRNGRLILHIRSPLGAIVNPGHEIASIVPAPDAVLSARNVRRARRVTPILSSDDVDEIIEGSAQLVGVLEQVGSAGDQRGAGRVADALVTMLVAHLKASSAGRGPVTRQQDQSLRPPINPSLAAASNLLIRLASLPSSTATRLGAVTAIDRLLELNPDGDAPLAFSLALFQSYRREESAEIADLLRLVGGAAVEAGDRQAASLCREVLERQIAEDSSRAALDIASYLCITAVWRNYFWIRDLWKWYVSLPAGTDELRYEHVMGALRIGATGNLSGNLSAALAAALFLKGQVQLPKLERLLRERGQIEQFLSDQHGHYLGEDAEASMVEYLKLAQVLSTSVA